MKKSTYTRTALASLLTIYSFSSFAADFSTESVREVEKQENTKTSAKMEVMKTANPKLKEKMDRICNADPRKKADELKKKADDLKRKEDMKLAAEQKKKEEARLASEKKAKLASEKEAKRKEAQALKEKNKALKEEAKAKARNAKAEVSDKTRSVKTVNKSVEKANPVVSSDGVDILSASQEKDGLRITFGGVVDAQGYGKVGPSGDEYKRYHIMAGKAVDYYSATDNAIKGANPIFPRGIGNLGDYSNDTGMIADAILHLRAENKNEELGLLYGTDVQFHVPVTEGKGTSQGINAARGRSAHVFINSEYGDVKLGYQFGPEALMRLDATRIATVDGGPDSDWYRKVNLEGSAASFPFYVTPRLYTESFSSESEKLSFRMAGKYNKGVMTTLPFRVAYYSPKYMGARFGISYAPHYEASLFSVSESAIGNPYTTKIDEITNSFVNASKRTFDSTADISGNTYKSTDEAIDALVTNNGSLSFDAAVTGAQKGAALDEAVKILPAIKEATLTVPTEYDRYGVKSVPSGIAAVDKPANAAAMKSELTGLEASLGTTGGTKDEFIKELKETLNEFLNKGADSGTARTAVEGAFQNSVLSEAVKGTWGSNSVRHVGPDYEHIISAGATYEYDFEEYKVKVKGSVVGEFGKAKQPNKDKHSYTEYVEYNDLMGVNLGVSADYKVDEGQSIKAAASFAYLGKSGQPKVIKTLSGNDYVDLKTSDPRVKGIADQFGKDSNDTMYWTAGAGYQRENIYTSLTYFGSVMNDGDKLHDVALGVQYDLSPACSKSKFVPYAVLHLFTTEEKQSVDHKITTKSGSGDVPPNKGALLLTGVKFSF